MEMNQIMQAISAVGFPIVMCGAMAYYVKYITDKHREQIEDLNAQHSEEIISINETISNNTVALQKLTNMIEKNSIEKEV